MLHPAIVARIFAPVFEDLMERLKGVPEPMNLYMCHKIVEAAKVSSVQYDHETGNTTLGLVDPSGKPLLPQTVPGDWVVKKAPEGAAANLVGGYFVKYPDGFTSWSPAKAFEEGYTGLPAEGDAMYALHAMRSGKKVARRGWNGVQAGLNMFVVMMPELHLPAFNAQELGPKVNDRTAKYIGEDTPLDSQPYFALHTGVAGANWQPGWTPSVMDCLANDWFVVE